MVSKKATEQILAECAIRFDEASDDCNKFVKRVAAAFFEPDLFTGPQMNADAIIQETEARWTSLENSHVRAIAEAKAGSFVIAGMTSTDLSATHGHLAVVVGLDGELSGTVVVPICYAGSLSAGARVQRRRVSETFPAAAARSGQVRYFSKSPETLPRVSPVLRLTDHLLGVRSHSTTVASVSSRTRRVASLDQPNADS